MRRASSNPEMISTSQPVVDRTHSRNALALRASRNALVATTRTESAPAFWTARWNRRSTFTVVAIASGDRKLLRNTDSPKRVTSRSSRMLLRRCLVRRAIFRRTEFDPISTAARVGMAEGQQCTVEEGCAWRKYRGQPVNSTVLLSSRLKWIEYAHAKRREIPLIPRCHGEFMNSCGCADHHIFEQIIWFSVHQAGPFAETRRVHWQHLIGVF